MSDILVELGTEELPPKALATLSGAFTQGVVDGLKASGIEAVSVESFATPRRLAMLLRDVPARQPDRMVEKRGPAVQAAFDDEGNPSKAALGFARSCGVEIEQLTRRETDKGAWLYFEQNQPGAAVSELLAAIVDRSLAQLPIPKRMRWGDREDEFVRPVHWLVMMIDDQPVEGTVLGTPSALLTQGHRFHCDKILEILQASDYETLLSEKGHVIAGFARRREMIREQVENTARQLGGTVKMDEDLLDEVTALVEWPVAISGRFDDDFLSVPSEALVTTMQDNQKYFAVFDKHERLMPFFITVANINSRQPELVAAGNERVIRPRFADAKFFWEQDQKVSLSSRLQSLETVVFQKQLGTIADKVVRIRSLAGYLAAQLGASVADAERAAELCKCDLMTDMVGEFPKLQGIMGQYYARHDGENDAVAMAIEQHYWPRYAGDATPAEVSGQCVAVADRIDTMLGIFAIGQKPTGVKDPFALRRAALGIIRILVENNLAINLRELLQQAGNVYADRLDTSAAIDEVIDYIFDRLKSYYQDQGIAPGVIDAVVSCRPMVLTDLNQRMIAVNEFLKHDAAESLAAANKRISNILRKQDSEIDVINPELLQEPAEQALYQQLSTQQHAAQQYFDGGDYLNGLNELALLRGSVDQFFDDVMVMADDPALRHNRLALLQQLSGSFLQVADFSRIQQA